MFIANEILNFSTDGVCQILHRVNTGICVAAIIIALIVVAFTLRNVHDGFWLKNEFKWFALFATPIGVFQFVANYFPALYYWTPVIANGVYLTNTVTAYVIPCLISLKKDRPRFGSSGASKSSLSSDVESPDRSRTESNAQTPKPIDILVDKLAQKFIEEFIAHFQLIRQSKLLLFYFDVLRFKELDNELVRTSKAWILYQKYIQEGAYISVDAITEEQREFLNEKITKAVEQQSRDPNDPQPTEKIELTSSLFDGVLKTVKKELKRTLVKPFMQSEYFGRYLEAIRLEKGLQLSNVTVSVSES